MQPKKVDPVGIKTGPDSTDKMMTTTDNPARIAGPKPGCVEPVWCGEDAGKETRK